MEKISDNCGKIPNGHVLSESLWDSLLTGFLPADLLPGSEQSPKIGTKAVYLHESATGVMFPY
jgi:hypothetical protein